MRKSLGFSFCILHSSQCLLVVAIIQMYWKTCSKVFINHLKALKLWNFLNYRNNMWFTCGLTDDTVLMSFAALSKDGNHMFFLRKQKSLKEIMLPSTLQLLQRQQLKVITYPTTLEYTDIKIEHKTSPSESSSRILHNPKQHLMWNAFRYKN